MKGCDIGNDEYEKDLKERIRKYLFSGIDEKKLMHEIDKRVFMANWATVQKKKGW